jgi:hypothetical protein
LTFTVSWIGALLVAAPHLLQGQEVFWYAVYAAALWVVVALLAVVYGTKNLESDQG